MSRREQVAALAGKRQKPALDLGVRLDSAVVQNVAHREAAFSEAARDQKATMAIEWLAFRAHQAEARTPGFCNHSAKPVHIGRFFRCSLIVGDAVAIKPLMARPAAERIAFERVRHAGGSKARR